MKLNLITLLLLTFTFHGFAQELEAEKQYDNKLSLSFGVLSTSQIRSMFDDSRIYSLSGGEFRTRANKNRIAVMFGYKFAIDEKLALGMTAGYDNAEGILINSNDVASGTFQRNAFTFAFEGEYRYFDGEIFDIYALGGLGVSFTGNEYVAEVTSDAGGFTITTTEGYSETSRQFNYQVSPVGFRFGKQVALFAEMGLGYKGVFCGGVSLKF